MIFVSKGKKIKKKRNRKILASIALSLLTIICISDSKNNLQKNTIVAKNDTKALNLSESNNKEGLKTVKSNDEINVTLNDLEKDNSKISRGGDVEEKSISKEKSLDDVNSDIVRGITVSSQKEIVKSAKPQIENLDWFSKAQYVYPIGAVAEVEDVYTGKTFKLKRTFGTNHADVEALTREDSEVIKNVWGGNYSWERRPVIVSVSGKRIAASMAAMPHAGNDAYPALAEAPDLSGGYGTGQNLDVVKNNGMDGVCDLHFLNSMRHSDGSITEGVDEEHQRCISIAASKK
ncbi:hypothetical protein [Clostridium sp. ATCC 25772]|uniref:hypothetical protein n=1 Tax=Clostridium sp. ATCC 25772 TaxID=1676991 RepID=UPI0007808DCD|nr:hypothetical protein [Clostridium sp. ATCC 25772]